MLCAQVSGIARGQTLQVDKKKLILWRRRPKTSVNRHVWSQISFQMISLFVSARKPITHITLSQVKNLMLASMQCLIRG